MRRFASLFGRRGVLAAASAALGVIAVVSGQQLVTTVSSGLVGFGYADALRTDYLNSIWAGLGISMLGFHLPFAVGVFTSLWLIAPVAAELRLAHVITRSLLAAGIGASLLLIVRGILTLIGVVAGMGSFFGNSFPPVPWDGAVGALSIALQFAIEAFVQLVPVVVLAGVFLWIWLQKHPSRHAVSGMLDEV